MSDLDKDCMILKYADNLRKLRVTIDEQLRNYASMNGYMIMEDDTLSTIAITVNKDVG